MSRPFCTYVKSFNLDMPCLLCHSIKTIYLWPDNDFFFLKWVTSLDFAGKPELDSVIALEVVCERSFKEPCRLQSCAAYSDCHDGSKWRVLCSPGTTGEVRDWITAPIDYCSHHCPSERPGQEMHPPPCGLLGGTAPLYCLQSGWLTVSHCAHFVNGATITCPGCAFSWDYLISELFPGSPLWWCSFEVLQLRQLCWICSS